MKCGSHPTPVSIQQTVSSGKRSKTPVNSIDVMLPAAIENTWLIPPIAFVTLTSHSQTDYSHALRHDAPHVSFLQEANKALRVISVATRRRELEAMARNAAASAATASSSLKSGAAANLGRIGPRVLGRKPTRWAISMVESSASGRSENSAFISARVLK